MAQQDKLTLEGKFNNTTNGLFDDNTAGDIGAGDSRTLVTDLKDSVPFTLDDSYTWPFPKADTTGTDTYAVTLSPAITAYTNGMKIHVKIKTASTGASTLNANAVGAKKIFTNPTTQAGSGDLVDEQEYIMGYDSALDSAVGGWLIIGGGSAGASIPFGSTTGTNTYSATMSPGVTVYENGKLYHVRVNISSTGVVTFDLGPGAKKAFDTAGEQAEAGYFKAGVDYLMTYNSALDSAAGGFSIVNELVHGIMNFRGTYTPGGSGLWPSAGGSGPSAGIRHGDAFAINGTDTLGTKVVNTGDFITTDIDAPGQTDSNWYVIPGPTSIALDADLTAIAALTPTNDDVLQRKAGAWTNRSIAELKTDLDYGGVSTWVPAWAGFSADPTSVVTQYTLIGKLCVCTLQCVAGTSNATTTTVTLPFNAATAAIQRGIIQVTNNGILQMGSYATQTSGTPVINLYPDAAQGAWTSSGSKRALFTISYFIE